MLRQLSDLLLKLLPLPAQVFQSFGHFRFFSGERGDHFLQVKDDFVVFSLFFGILSILSLRLLQLLLKHLDLALEVVDLGLQVLLLQPYC